MIGASCLVITVACAPKSTVDGASPGSTEGIDGSSGGSSSTPQGTHTGAGTTTGGGTGAGTGSGGPDGVLECTSPQPVMLLEDENTPGEVPAGYEYCEGGAFDRTQPVTCEWAPMVEPCLEEHEGECTSNEDCPDDGDCWDDWQGCECVLACDSDGDCPTNHVCLCGAGTTPVDADWHALYWRNECLPAECLTSADCNGSACGVAFSGCGRPVGLFCRTPADECYEDADCPQVEDNMYCGYGDGRWVCLPEPTCE